MVKRMDRFWVARGLGREEIAAVRWRGGAYALLLALAALCGALAVATLINLAA